MGAPSPAPVRRARSLESRLSIQLLLVLVLLWLGGAFFAAHGLRVEVDEVQDSALTETAERLLMLHDARLGGSPDHPTIVEEFDSTYEHVVYQILDLQGHVLLKSQRAPDQAMAPGAPDGLTIQPPWRVISMTHPGFKLRAQVAEAAAHREYTLWRATLALLVPLLLMLPLSLAGLHLVLRQAFRRLRPITDNLSQRPAHDLQAVPLDNAPAELHPLLHTVNGLMARVHTLLEAERMFSANMAHELRTPLAAARAQAQRLARESATPAASDRAQALVRQLDRLTRLTTRMLEIVRIDAGVGHQREPVDLGMLARMVMDEFPQSREPQRLRFESDDDEPVMVLGDTDVLGMAVRNLIDNALKHGGETAQVVVTVRPGLLSVTDDGPGMPDGDLDTLTRPFERGVTLASGTGLGLSLVQSIADQAGARLQLESPVRDGRGWRATLRFDFESTAPVRPA